MALIIWSFNLSESFEGDFCRGEKDQPRSSTSMTERVFVKLSIIKIHRSDWNAKLLMRLGVVKSLEYMEWKFIKTIADQIIYMCIDLGFVVYNLDQFIRAREMGKSFKKVIGN
jgi:hypothetical protein